MKNKKLYIIGTLLSLTIVSIWYSMQPSLLELTQSRLWEIIKRQEELNTNANAYRDLIKILWTEYDLLQKEREPLDEIVRQNEIKQMKIIKTWSDYEQLKLINYAYEISNNVDFIYTIEAESSKWSVDIVSVANSNGTKDYWICMLNSQYHSKFINSEDFKDWYKQLDYCWGVYQDWIKKSRLETTFYGYNARSKVKDRFIINN